MPDPVKEAAMRPQRPRSRGAGARRCRSRGELVTTVPFGPRDPRKVNINPSADQDDPNQRAGRIDANSGEGANTSKDTSDIVSKSANKLDRHVQTDAAFGYATAGLKISAGLSDECSRSNRETSSRLNEDMENNHNRMKHDTKVSSSVEGESSSDEESTSELTNSDDELGVTYLYSRLQERFWVGRDRGRRAVRARCRAQAPNGPCCCSASWPTSVTWSSRTAPPICTGHRSPRREPTQRRQEQGR